MFSSLRLGSVFGVDLYIHGTFWLLPAMIIFSGFLSGDTAGLALDLAVIFAVFGCVALHELGHALAARTFGVRTKHITLYPIGGVAQLERMPDKPGPEIVIALAGPAVNVAIAGILLLLLILLAPWFPPDQLLTVGAGEFFQRLLVINVVLVLFNLIPAFPMDGGRVFRAFLQLFTDRVNATSIAVTVGSIIATLFFLYGFFVGNLTLIFIGGVVFLLGQAELAGVRMQEEQKRRAAARPPIIPVSLFWPDSDGDGVRPTIKIVSRPDGWEWDPKQRIWTEWRGGIPVRRVSGE
jgi:Zn-dependent protease